MEGEEKMENKLKRVKRPSQKALDSAKKTIAVLMTVMALAGAPVVLTSCTSPSEQQAVRYAVSTDCDKAANEITNIVADQIDGKYYIGIKFNEIEKKSGFLNLKVEKERFIAVYVVDKNVYYAFLSQSGKDDGRAWLSNDDWAIAKKVADKYNPIKVVNYDSEITLKEAVAFANKNGSKFYRNEVDEVKSK